MATIKNNGQEVILLCNMGYDYNGKKIKPVAKSVIVPDDVIPAVWLGKQAEIFENEVKLRRTQPMPLALFLINHKEEIGASISNKDTQRISQRLGLMLYNKNCHPILKEFDI